MSKIPVHEPANCADDGGGGGGGLASKLANTSPVVVTEQLPGPWQEPPHPANVEPDAGCAESATDEPPCAVIVQRPGQSIPGGEEATRPLPLPVSVTFTSNVGGGGDVVKAAVTLASDVKATSHDVDVPEHAPAQPAKEALIAGDAVSVTRVPEATFAAHTPGQEMPAGLDVTLPGPVTETVSLTACDGGDPAGGVSDGEPGGGSEPPQAQISNAAIAAILIFMPLRSGPRAAL